MQEFGENGHIPPLVTIVLHKGVGVYYIFFTVMQTPAQNYVAKSFLKHE